ncbi:uncharacterized protein EKO05_0004659 [Ascochyta rabiei]|uniref:Uncharacterized protein n=1 Tax=Didymella rabiei TaxID=5454 RepID=A0A163KQR0_DIDRA|nr:uncharacterized protein EKO05_0004659 [Ascochyta rabiei]KZM27177.1 hypothetical protein ST47_g1706 [Ascochyta rabiei]UPX14169.1 hypothetical protein EKO05_0004659 [Ascochyta rabiei]
MASYLQKLRPKSKQTDPAKFRETVVHNAPKTEEASKRTGPVPSPPPAPAISEPADETGAEPVLDEEDEKFLERLAAIAQEPEGTPPPLPGRTAVVVDENGQQKVGKDAQQALMDGADKIALPNSPPEKKAFASYFALPKFGKKGDKGDKEKDASPKDKKGKAKVTEAERNELADNLLAAAAASKAAEQTEAEKETQDLTKILEELNLSAVNNRVFSFSKESEELLQKFTLVLKDIVNGAPTAYNDLEKLFTDYDGQLKKMYGSLPPFLQNFVKTLPAKLTAGLGPELLAASAEKPGFDAKQRAGGAGSKSKKSRLPGVPKIPSLKQLVSAQGAVATALRSILNFLKFRFPALATGTNLIMSLAVMILLFVFWYCHKRGRETRLEKERLAADTASAEASGTSSAVASDDDSVFGDKKRQKTKATSEPVPRVEGEATEPLIIKDDKEKATVHDLPDVTQLPDPGTAPERR